MRIPAVLLCAAIAVSNTHAQTLSDADREALLDSLEKLRESAVSKMDGKYRVALAAFRNAMGGDEQAIELYLNCVERVNYDEQQRKTQDFREWKRKEADRLADPAFRRALRVQLGWLVLAIQASAEKPDVVKLRTDAEEILDSIFRDAEKLKGQERMLAESVNSSVFARAYDINHLKEEKWPLTPVNLEQIYGQVLLPPLRTPARLAALRTTWLKRIQQEGAKREFLETNGGGGGRGQDPRKPSPPIGTPTGHSPDYERFLAEDVPKLQWEMEVDLFNAGDESGAAVRMLAHIEKNIAHPSAREWGEQFKKLLAPKTPVTPAPAAPETVQ